MENNFIESDIFKKVFKVEKSIYENILKGDHIFFVPLEEYTYFSIIIHRENYSTFLCTETLEDFFELFNNLKLSIVEDKFEEIKFCFESLKENTI